MNAVGIEENQRNVGLFTFPQAEIMLDYGSLIPQLI